MEGLLKDANPLRTADVVELCALLGRLHLTLTQKLAVAVEDPETESMRQTDRVASRPVTPEAKDLGDIEGGPSHHLSMHHRSILPPLPEVRQVRKTSYGVI